MKICKSQGYSEGSSGNSGATIHDLHKCWKANSVSHGAYTRRNCRMQNGKQAAGFSLHCSIDCSSDLTLSTVMEACAQIAIAESYLTNRTWRYIIFAAPEIAPFFVSSSAGL